MILTIWWRILLVSVESSSLVGGQVLVSYYLAFHQYSSIRIVLLPSMMALLLIVMKHTGPSTLARGRWIFQLVSSSISLQALIHLATKQSKCSQHNFFLFRGELLQQAMKIIFKFNIFLTTSSLSSLIFFLLLPSSSSSSWSLSWSNTRWFAIMIVNGISRNIHIISHRYSIFICCYYLIGPTSCPITTTTVHNSCSIHTSRYLSRLLRSNLFKVVIICLLLLLSPFLSRV